MQRDFKINALRTKTKYKLTSLRTGMKKHIKESLREMFKGFLGVPVEFLKERNRTEYLKQNNEKNEFNINEKKEININEKKEININEKKGFNIDEKKVSTIEKNLNKKNFKTSENKPKNDLDQDDSSHTFLADLSVFEEQKAKNKRMKMEPFSKFKLPGLKKYNDDTESSAVDDSLIAKKRKGRPRNNPKINVRKQHQN